MAESDQKPPLLEYPALYTFRVIGKRSPALREHVRLIVQSVLGPVAEDSVTVRPSAQGNYLAVHVTVLLQTEEQRVAVYGKLYGDPMIVMSLNSGVFEHVQLI